MAPDGPGRAGQDDPQTGGPHGGPRRRDRHLGLDQYGQAFRAGQARRGPLGLELSVLRRPPARQRRRGLPDGQRPPQLQRIRAGWRRRGHLALELPPHDGQLEDRARHRLGQHVHHQTVGGHSRVGHLSRRARRRGRLPAWRPERPQRLRAPGRLRHHRRRPRRPGHLHRLQHHGQGRDGFGRNASGASLVGARRQGCQYRLRRCRHRQCGLLGRRGDLPQRRPDLPGGLPALRPGRHLRRVHEAVRRRSRSPDDRRPLRPGDELLLPRQQAALRQGRLLCRGCARPGRHLPHRRHRRGRVLGRQADDHRRPRAGRRPLLRGDLRPGLCRQPLRDRRGSRPPRQRHPLRTQRHAVHGEPLPCAPCRLEAAGRHCVGQLLLHPRPAHPVRRRRRLRRRP